MRESIEIYKHDRNFNQEDGYTLPKAWQTTLITWKNHQEKNKKEKTEVPEQGAYVTTNRDHTHDEEAYVTTDNDRALAGTPHHNHTQTDRKNFQISISPSFQLRDQ